MLESYVYRPLLQAPNSTRLLSILPGAEKTDVHCLIHDYTLRLDRASGPYEALSYVWGDPKERRRIYVQDAQHTGDQKLQSWSLDVTANLHAALCRLRDQAFSRLMWVDAVCINQDNLQERAAQVQFMAMIYAHASRVIVWLGEEADDSAGAFAAIERAAMEDRRRHECRRSIFPERSTEAPSSPEGLAVTETQLVALFARPWFHRIWVLQEVAAARNVSILCGEVEITGDSFVRGLPAFLGAYDSALQNLAISVNQMMLWEIPSNSPNASRTQSTNEIPGLRLNILSLGQLLDKFHHHEASDQRDKVFALLGTCRTSHYASEPPKPDYTRTWSLVFQDVIHYLLGSSPEVTTWDDREKAVVTGYGCALGQVTVSSPNQITVDSSHFSGPQNSDTAWTLDVQAETSCKDVKIGDILWHMEGASFPCILRFCNAHFDVVRIAAPIQRIGLRPSFDTDSGNTVNRSLSWPEVRASLALSSKRRQITLVWDWSREPEQDLGDHGVLQEVDTSGLYKHLPLEGRVTSCARVLDDLRSWDKLQSMLLVAPQLSPGPELRRHLQLLEMACSHWDSYLWLKSYIEELRWGIYRLKSSEPWPSDESSQLYAYWECEGCLPYDILEITSLSKMIPASSIARDHQTHEITLWTFGEFQHTILLSALFSEYVGSQAVQQASSHDEAIPDRRYLMRLMLNQQPFTLFDGGMSTVDLLLCPPSPHADDTISTIHTDATDTNHKSTSDIPIPNVDSWQAFLDFGRRMRQPENPLAHLPKPSIPLSNSQPSRIKNVRSELIRFALASEKLHHNWSLSTEVLESLALEAEASEIFSFLLAEANRDTLLVYDILTVAIKHRLQVKGFDTLSTHESLLDHRSTSQAKPKCHPMVLWFHKNRSVLRIYIEHTDLCDIAQAHADDIVMDALFAVFSADEQPESKDARSSILRGLSEFAKEQGELHQSWGAALSEGWRIRFQMRATENGKIDPVLFKWGNAEWWGRSMAEKGRVREVFEDGLRGWRGYWRHS